MIDGMVLKSEGWKYYLCGVEVAEEEYRAVHPLPASDVVMRPAKAKWPIISRALAVHPKQVEEAREAAKRAGVPTDFLPDGRPIITSQKHQNEYAKSRSLVNADRYY